MKKRWIAVLLAAALLLGVMAGCAQESSSEQSIDEASGLLQFAPLQEGEKIAVMHTSMGDIKLRFFPEQAPRAVENFLTHAEKGYYTGVTFHRVINDFMIQGGDPTGTGAGGTSIWGAPFEDEFSPLLSNFRGALSMANSGANTNGSQFFIVQATSVDASLVSQMKQAGEAFFSAAAIEKYEEIGGTPWLDYVHTVFGHVYEGMDVVDAIAAVELNNSTPVVPVTIDSIEILEYKAE